MTMTALQLMKFTTKSRRDNALSARIKEIKRGTLSNGSLIYKAKIMTTRTPAGVRKPPPPMYTYVTTVEVDKKKKCIVSCSCEDFLYFSEWTLSKKGAARIEYSNGEPSNDRNKTQVPSGCKHVYALLTKLTEKGRL